MCGGGGCYKHGREGRQHRSATHRPHRSTHAASHAPWSCIMLPPPASRHTCTAYIAKAPLHQTLLTVSCAAARHAARAVRHACADYSRHAYILLAESPCGGMIPSPALVRPVRWRTTGPLPAAGMGPACGCHAYRHGASRGSAPAAWRAGIGMRLEGNGPRGVPLTAS